ncbi:putative short-chain dehydrogenase [Catenovulum agarivorans DS-2]|uniref:Putative short-chain dehydrogenase n=1 Tax=Catenovulum agarivorans DS-2 TaxID=1328313 RepID=W7QHE1_9ALTE|nr:SDR family NAD(P)-dependent oxidoreductase [Catenovulum agarivorans]EWH12364.1 putative short-chain dehydrogenase [Catenovulum agarivorans DS-2]
MKHILITGASSGIGREIAIQASKLGYKLSLTGRNPDKLQRTQDSLAINTENFSRSLCVTDQAALVDFTNSAKEQLGDFDIVINCAGINTARGKGEEISIAELEWMMKINFYSPVQIMQLCLPSLKHAAKQNGCATIVNVLSTVCLFSNPGIAAYTASKAALDHYVKVMRKELKADNIKMLSVYPGGVDTEFRAAERPEYLTAAAVAKAILHSLDTDANTHIHDLVLRPQVEENF